MYKFFQKLKDKILPQKESIRQTDCVSTLKDPLFLSPDPNIDGNDDYIHWLDIAIDRPTATNIALTGGYGSGKSSILEKFIIVSKYRKRILKISFSTLGANPKDYSPPIDDKEIISGQNGDNNQKSNSKKSEKRFISNIIQKEIVKQLLKEINISKYIDTKLSNFGLQLLSFIKNEERQNSSIVLSITDKNGNIIERTDLGNSSMWLEISKATDSEDAILLNWKGYGVYEPNSRHIQKLSKNDLERIALGDSIDFDELTMAREKEIIDDINEKEHLRTNLRSANIQQFLLLEQKFDNLFTTTFDEIIRSTFEINSEQPSLGYDLIKSGLIDENYILYYSVYSGLLSSSALTYKINNIQKNIIDVQYRLSNDDLDKIFNDIGETYADSISMFNIDIITYLLTKADKRTDELFRHLGSNSEKVQETFSAYLKSSENMANKKKFIRSISKYYSNVISNLIEINSDNLNELISEAIISSDIISNFTLSDAAIKYLTTNLSSIKPFKISSKSSAEELKSSIEVIKKSDIKFNSVIGINVATKEMVKNLDLYEINKSNIKTLFGQFGSISLNSLYTNHRQAYEYMVDNINKYLEVINEYKSQYSLDESDTLQDIILNIIEKNPDQLDEIFSKSDTSKCVIDSILTFPQEIWTLLIAHSIVKPSLTNMLEYFRFSEPNNIGALNECLSTYLNTKKDIILDKPSLEEYDKNEVLKLIVAILNKDAIDLDVKRSILVNLYKTPIDTSLILHKDSSVFGMLLSTGYITDDISSYNYIKDLSWGTKYDYIVNSKNFLEYIESITFSHDDILNISSSKSTLNLIKDSMLNNLAKYELEMSADITNNFIMYVGSKSINLSPDNLRILAKNSKIEPFLGILNSRLNTLNQLETLSILNSLGDEYEKISKFTTQAKLRNTPDNLRLVEHLIAVKIVSSTRTSGDNNEFIKVFMKKQPLL